FASTSPSVVLRKITSSVSLGLRLSQTGNATSWIRSCSSAPPSARLAQVAAPLLALSKAPRPIPDRPRHERRGEGNPGHNVHDDKALNAHAGERDESERAPRQQVRGPS